MKEIYQVLSAAMGEETRMEQIANNLANVSTVGFKRDGAVFMDYLKIAQNPPQPGQASSSTSSIPYYTNGYIDFTPGNAIETGQTFDLMIEGDGFFEIEDPTTQEIFYTRAGNFLLNEDQELVTVNGERVLDGSGGAITIDSPDGKVTIESDGAIYIGGVSSGSIKPVQFDDLSVLTKAGNSLFRASQGTTPHAADNAVIHQGTLEGSNIKPIEEMVRMIQTQRTYQTHQKAMQFIDETTGRRINQILNS